MYLFKLNFMCAPFLAQVSQVGCSSHEADAAIILKYNFVLQLVFNKKFVSLEHTILLGLKHFYLICHPRMK